jgi:outer membrane protein OmpA-like peptidoglycan-associated protein
MRRSLLVLIILGISSGALASGYALWTYVSSDRNEMVTAAAIPSSSATSKPASAGKSAALTPSSPALPPGTSALLAIEVARIEAGGPSVLAGRSPPNHKVTVLANGREVANVIASDEGQWSAIVTDGIAAGPLELSIVSQPKDGGAQVRGLSRQVVVPEAGRSLATVSPQTKTASADNRSPAARAAPQPVERPQVEVKRPQPGPAQGRTGGEEASNKRALAEFEALVDRTRKEVAGQQPPRPSSAAQGQKLGSSSDPAAPRSAAAFSAPIAAPSAPAATAPETKIASAGIPPASIAPRASSTPAAVQAPIPVPITFVSNQVVLTPGGERAASLLAEYLRLKRPASITLSGHADARGPDGYNMRLSLRRLEAIERYLRAAGYSGGLSLVPRGKRDPFQGIDRRRLPLREIQQADRRVELQLTP